MKPTMRALTRLMLRSRSTAAHQGRRCLDHRLEHPADAELQIVRRETFELERAGVQAQQGVEVVDIAGLRVAKIDVAIGELNRQPWGDLVREPGVQRTGEAEFRADPIAHGSQLTRAC